MVAKNIDLNVLDWTADIRPWSRVNHLDYIILTLLEFITK